MLQHLIDTFFLPFLLLAAGALLLAPRYGKNGEKTAVYSLAAAFLLLLTLRISVARSSRYYLILQLPLLTLTGFCLLFLERCRLFHFRHWSRTVIVLLILVCMVKVFRPAPYRQVYRQMAQRISHDADAFPNGAILLRLAEDDRRNAYYSRICVFTPQGENNGHEVSFQELVQSRLREFRHTGKPVYIIRKESRKDAPLSKENLSLSKADDWLLVCALPSNCSGSRVLRCYRYTPAPNSVPFPTGEALNANGDFRIAAGEKERQEILARVHRLCPDYFSLPTLREPAGWLLLPGSNTPRKLRRIKAELSDSPRGMLFSADLPILFSSGTPLPVGDYCLSLSLIARENSAMTVKARRQMASSGTIQSSDTIAYLPLLAGERMHKTIPFTVSERNGETAFFIAFLLQHGSVVLEKAELFRSEMQKK